ncbi:MAG: DUF354 domain-containing protein [Candidatus Kapaibacterium sp.]
MRILIDIGHPAHVHLFKYFYYEMKKNGNELLFTIKDNLNTAIALLKYYGIEYETIGLKADNLLSKGINQIKYNLKLRNIIKRRKVDIGIGTSISIAHVSKISEMKSIILDDDDDEVEPLFVKFAHPYCDVLLSPDALREKRKKKDTIYYRGYHELAYLHPNRFTPDSHVLREAGIEDGEKFYVMRFNVFKAHHDIGIKGITLENKLKLVEMLQKYGKVFITTEREIEPELKEYQFNLHPSKVHSFLYYAEIFIGDSQTMTSEAAVLGTPSLKCNSFAGKLSVPNDLETKYGLCYSYLPDDFEKMIEKIKELLTLKDLKQEWKKRREKMLNDKIDVTTFLLEFVDKLFKELIIHDK